MVMASGNPWRLTRAEPADNRRHQFTLHTSNQPAASDQLCARITAVRDELDSPAADLDALNDAPVQAPVGDKLLLTVDEAMDLIGVPRSRLFALIRDGELQSSMLGGRRYIRRSDVDAFVDKLFGANR